MRRFESRDLRAGLVSALLLALVLIGGGAAPAWAAASSGAVAPHRAWHGSVEAAVDAAADPTTAAMRPGGPACAAAEGHGALCLMFCSAGCGGITVANHLGAAGGPGAFWFLSGTWFPPLEPAPLEPPPEGTV